jgi:hypothetical protein
MSSTDYLKISGLKNVVFGNLLNDYGARSEKNFQYPKKAQNSWTLVLRV